MSLDEVRKLIDNKAVISVISAGVGALFWKIVAEYRNRIKTLEYTVTHERIGLSAEDEIFGRVIVTWQGSEVKNLYVSTVTIINDTTKDYCDLKIKVYTNGTLLLSERSQIVGTAYIVKYSNDYINSIKIGANETPSDPQMYMYWHTREYNVPVFNRKQKITITYLTSVPPEKESPAVFVDILHPSVKIVFKPIFPEIHGVPVKYALPIGLIACALMFLVVTFSIKDVRLASLIMVAVGLYAQSVGAYVYKGLRWIKKLLLG